MVRYASFIDRIEAEGVEDQPGCEQCKENRQVLEKTWQVVANEYYDVNGQFSQREWAAQLLSALQVSPGLRVMLLIVACAEAHPDWRSSVTS